jgi:hypothetical protein
VAFFLDESLDAACVTGMADEDIWNGRHVPSSSNEGWVAYLV